jgi:hypothetical protein
VEARGCGLEPIALLAQPKSRVFGSAWVASMGFSQPARACTHSTLLPMADKMDCRARFAGSQGRHHEASKNENVSTQQYFVIKPLT